MKDVQRKLKTEVFVFCAKLLFLIICQLPRQLSDYIYPIARPPGLTESVKMVLFFCKLWLCVGVYMLLNLQNLCLIFIFL